MAYDPYMSEEQEQGKPFNPFSPAGWLWAQYSLNPITYSASKGLWSPIGWRKGKFSEFYKKVSRAPGFWGKTKTAWKERRLIGPKHIGGPWLQETGAISALREQIGNDLTRLYAQNKLKLSRNMKGKLVDAILGWGSKKTQKIEGAGFVMTKTPGTFGQELYDILLKTEGMPRTTIAREATKKIIPEIVSRMETTIAGSTVLQKARRSMAKKTTWELLAGKGARSALRLARFGSWVGLSFLIKDVAMMIGEPIGRVLINRTDQILQQFDERFMPEIGGKLMTSYLSYGAATERQRAVQAISKAYINGRSAYGQEAMYMHS